MTFLATRTNDEHARITADYQQNGKHMRAKRKPGKNLYKWFKGLSIEYGRLEETLNDIFDGRLITKATTFVFEWEQAIGIPDNAFPGSGTAAERQRHIVTKLSAEGVSTATELEWLCSLMGFSVTVWPGHYFWTHPDARVSFSTEKESRFTVVFEINFDLSLPIVQPNLFPVPFPWVFSSNNYNILQDFMLDVIPSNCNGLWIVAGGVWQDTLGGSPVMQDTLGGSPVAQDTF